MQTYFLILRNCFFKLQSSVQIPTSKHTSTLSQKNPYPATTFSPSAEGIAQSELTPPISDETHLKFVWIQSDVENYYESYKKTIKPASSSHYDPTELLSEIPNDWINSRIFLCLSARNARNILPQIHRKVELYRVYILCNEKSEEDQFSRNDETFGKIRLVTSDETTFIQQLALDVVPSTGFAVVLYFL